MPKLYTSFSKFAMVACLSLFFVLIGAIAMAKEPNDPNYSNQRHFWDQINAPLAWDKTTGSNRIIVAVIDTGIDTSHPDLKDNIWKNVYEIPDNGKDDDQNGFVDDFEGWNFIDNNNIVNPNVNIGLNDPDAVKHGTLIAGLIGAKSNNGQDGVGLNWDVRIMPIKAIDNVGWGSFSDIAKAIHYAVNNGADIITMSFVGPDLHAALKTNIEFANRRGVIIVSAAGNDRLEGIGDLDLVPQYPACLKEGKKNIVVTVGAVDINDKLSSFSNFGSCLDLVAPGQDLYSVQKFTGMGEFSQSSSGAWHGTSFSAPLVAGTAALIKTIQPRWSNEQIINTILDTSKNIGVKNLPFINGIGKGRLDTGAAVAKAAVKIKPAPVNDRLYFYNGNQIFTVGLPGGGAERFAKIEGATITAIATYDFDGNKIDEPAVLFKRDKFYAVRIFKENNDWWSSFSVKGIGLNGYKVKRIKLMRTKAELPTILLEEYNPAINKTTITEFTIGGKATGKKLIYNNKIDFWAAGREISTVVIAILNNKTLTLEQINWDTNESNSWQEHNVLALTDLKLGVFFGDTEEQTTVLIQKSGRTLQYVIDLPSKSRRQIEVTENTKAGPLLLWTDDWDRDGRTDIMRYNQSGGEYEINTAKHRFITTVEMSKIEGKLE